ncbi:DUF6879 family protein [Streptomyces sp. TLI_171]|uniref:DUF6879 family protein n=1 Tax=Streptomyces sp. TLI_171 TaxID=1938859 RepID=UPI000C19677D|nr:DUF6879 family protein [Streptomyces sp. TLI_171]RKE02904.1 hypothetical protein BX266_7507 [Streptomyces sp. TLI_171]
MWQSAPDFDQLLGGARYSAVHLELRDSYSVPDEADAIERFRLTGASDLDPESEYWRDWTAMVSEAAARGIVVRRARIVSEPVTLYTRYLHSMTQVNVTAGEQVRWLARRNACDLALPGEDFWLIDSARVRFNHFTGDGDWAEPKFSYTEDADVAKLCTAAFDAVWERAVPHEQYTV